MAPNDTFRQISSLSPTTGNTFNRLHFDCSPSLSFPVLFPLHDFDCILPLVVRQDSKLPSPNRTISPKTFRSGLSRFSSRWWVRSSSSSPFSSRITDVDGCPDEAARSFASSRSSLPFKTNSGVSRANNMVLFLLRFEWGIFLKKMEAKQKEAKTHSNIYERAN